MENGKMDPGFSSLYSSSMKTDTKHRHCTKTTLYLRDAELYVCLFSLFKVKVVLIVKGVEGRTAFLVVPL
jgi:hypothetical protein